MAKNIKYFFFLITFISIGFWGNGQTAGNFKTVKNVRVSRAYGYLLSQQYSLNRIKEIFPALKQQVIISSSNFNVAFGNARVNMEEYLKGYLGESEFQKFIMDGKDAIRKMEEENPIGLEDANAYLLEIDKRAKGEIPNPILETLLHFQYLNTPSNEFSNGYTKVYSTKNHPKAKGLDMQFKVPLSWRSMEGDRPNVVQKFVTDYGDGLETVVLVVKDLGQDFTQDEFVKIFLEDGGKSFLPDGSNLISTDRTKFDQNEGFVIVFNQTRETLGIKVQMRVMMFYIVYKNKLINFSCGIGSPGSDIELQKRYSQLAPLFLSVGRSIVFNSQYK